MKFKKYLLFIVLSLCSFAFSQENVDAGSSAGENTSQVVSESSVETVSEVPPAAPLPKPLGRVKNNTGVNNESSSFMGDPDSADPMKINRDSIKEDEEPVLEDIRGVLDAPAKVKSGDKSKAINKNKSNSKTENDVTTKGIKKKAAKVSKKSKKRPVRKKLVQIDPSLLIPDSPDVELEKRLYQNYKKYHSEPTADLAWAEASKNQKVYEYLVQKGDTLSSISKTLFGDTSFWPKLWAMNRQGILNPHFINPKTTIYFYMGDDIYPPTLSVGENSAKFLDDINKKAHKLTDRDIARRIPNSLPVYRNEGYFVEPRQINTDVEIDLGKFPEPMVDNRDRIILADQVIKSEVGLKINETTLQRCHPGRILKDIRFVNELSENYDIYLPLEPFMAGDQKIYPYHIYGQAVKYEEQFLKVLNCNNIISTTLVFLEKNKINNYKTNKASFYRRALLVGGPDVNTQQFFTRFQTAYVDFGLVDYEVGQKFSVQSQLSDQINGEISILGKYGSYAVVLITDVVDTMQVGDSIVSK